MQISDTLFCDGCGVEIFGASIKAGQRDYCCEDCSNGKACHCGDRWEDDGYTRSLKDPDIGVLTQTTY